MPDRTTPEPGERSFEDMLADPLEQFGLPPELLASIMAYSTATSGTVGAQPLQPAARLVCLPAAEVERLRAELAKVKAERDAKLRTKALGRSLVEMEGFAQRETARADKAEYDLEIRTHTARSNGKAHRIAYLESEKQRERAEAAEAERDLLRETLAESDLGAQVLAQWEAIAAADADRDRLEAERDALKAAIAALLTAQGRMLDDWAEANEDRRRELWQRLHEEADRVRAALDGAHSPAAAPSPVTAATEAHGETTEAQEG